jgi:hypothetical protein
VRGGGVCVCATRVVLRLTADVCRAQLMLRDLGESSKGVVGAMVEDGSGVDEFEGWRELGRMLDPASAPQASRVLPFRARRPSSTQSRPATGALLRPRISPAAPTAMATGSSLTWKRKSAHLTSVKDEADDGDFVRKKLKLSDLPVAASQRSTIDALLLTFKKSGEFDKLRKALFAQFESSVSGCITALTGTCILTLDDRKQRPK